MSDILDNLDRSPFEVAKEHIAKLNNDIADIHQQYAEKRIRRVERHEQQMQDDWEDFLRAKEPLERMKSSIIKAIVDIEMLKPLSPMIIVAKHV